MLGLAALDLILRSFRARVVRIAINIEIARMDANDPTADVPGLRVPAHMISDLELVLHGDFPLSAVRFQSPRWHQPEPFASIMRLKPALKQGCFDHNSVLMRTALLGRHCSAGADTHTFFTIGHSTRTIAEFVDLLRVSRVDLVVDVRSIPRSRTNPQFNGDSLPATLAQRQIGYEHIAALGGRRGKARNAEPSPNVYWRVRGFRNYADYALTKPFGAGLARLRELGGQHRCAIMCAEAVWWRCHRRIITDYLLSQGDRVMHIIEPSRVDEASLTPAAEVCRDHTILYLAESSQLE